MALFSVITYKDTERQGKTLFKNIQDALNYVGTWQGFNDSIYTSTAAITNTETGVVVYKVSVKQDCGVREFLMKEQDLRSNGG